MIPWLAAMKPRLKISHVNEQMATGESDSTQGKVRPLPDLRDFPPPVSPRHLAR